MNEAQLLGPRGWGEPCGSAALKADAEHFQVDEVLDIELSGTGEHLWLWIEKRQLNTEDVARRLAKAAGVRLRDVGYAGLKDRQALTRQWFSIHVPGREVNVCAVQDEQLLLLQSSRHTRKLQRGAHSANGFSIRLTRLCAERSQLEQRLQQIKQFGVPNYFGMQRFGYEGGNLQQAVYYAQQQKLPERRNLRSRLLSTARSAIFNQILAARVERGTWQQALLGDLLTFTQSRSHFLAGPEQLDDPRLTALDVHPSGALWGVGELASEGQPRQLEKAVAADNALLCHWLEEAGLKQERRILRLPVRQLKWDFIDAQCLQLSFVLPVGCYATAVVRELIDVLPVIDMETACES